MEPMTINTAGSTIEPFVTSLSLQQTETTIFEIPSGSSDTPRDKPSGSSDTPPDKPSGSSDTPPDKPSGSSDTPPDKPSGSSDTHPDNNEENTPKLANGSDPMHDNSKFPHLLKDTWMAEIPETTDRTSENLGDTCKACLKGNFKRLKMHLSKNPLCWKAYNVDTSLPNYETISSASLVSKKNVNTPVDIDKITFLSTSPSVVCKGCNRGGIKRLKMHLAFAPFCRNVYTRLDAEARKSRRCSPERQLQNENGENNQPNPHEPSTITKNFPSEVEMEDFTSSSSVSSSAAAEVKNGNTLQEPFIRIEKVRILKNDNEGETCKSCKMKIQNRETHFAFSQLCRAAYGLLEQDIPTSKSQSSPEAQRATSEPEPPKKQDDSSAEDSSKTTPKYFKYIQSHLKSPIAHSEPSKSPKVGRFSSTGDGNIQSPALPLNRKPKACRGCHKKPIKHIKMHFVRSPQCRAAYGLSTNNDGRHFSDSQLSAKNKKIVSVPSEEVKMTANFDRRKSQRIIPKNFGSTCKGCKTKGIPSIGTHLKMSPRCYRAYKSATSNEIPAQVEDVTLRTVQDDEISVRNDIQIKSVWGGFGPRRIQRVTCNVCKKTNIKQINKHLAMSPRCRSQDSGAGRSYISQRTQPKKNLDLAHVAKEMSKAKSRKLPPGCVGITKCKYCKKETKRIRMHLTLSPRCQQAYDLHDLALQAEARLMAVKSVWHARHPKKHAALGGRKSVLKRKVQRRRMVNDAKASNTNQRKKPVLPKSEQKDMDSVRAKASEETSKLQVPDIQEKDSGLVSEVIEDTDMIRFLDNERNRKSGTPKADRSNGYLSDSSDSSRATSTPIRGPKNLPGPQAVASQEPRVVSTPVPTFTSPASAISIELKDVLKVFKDSWDEDDLFMSSMTCALKQIQHSERQEVKMKIMKLIYEAPRTNQETTTSAKH